MTRRKLSVLFSFVFCLQCFQVIAQKNHLPISVPEAEGVSSEGIIQFLDAAAASKTEFHSFMILRHGNIVAQGWWNPYAAELKHTMYSCSKSFTATAVGFAIAEKKLNLNDKVISFFPGQVPDTVSIYLAELTIRDVLIMSDGQEPDPTGTVVSRDSNWIKGFLAVPIVNKPGTTFLYNSLGTYMLSAIVQKVTGQKVVDYLKPRLFDPLGIEGMDWEVDPQGINSGGWGLRIKTEDMAKFGQLFLQNGVWKGKQILPVGWAEEASSVKIIQHPGYSRSRRDSSDWEQGYCYQMWRCRPNAYRADGAFGQYIIIMPDEDAVVAITAETPDMQEEINLVWQYLLPAFHSEKLPVNTQATAKLAQKIASLALPLPLKTSSPVEASVSGKVFNVARNDQQIKSLSFYFHNTVCDLQLATDTANFSFSFGAGSWKSGETTKPGPSLVGSAKAHFVGLPPSKVEGAYSWKDNNTLALTLRYIESPHTQKFTCHFDGKNLSVDIENSLDVGGKKVTLNGTVNQ